MSIVPGNVTAALVSGPDVSVAVCVPHNIEWSAHHMPGVPVVGIQIGDDALGNSISVKRRKVRSGSVAQDTLEVVGLLPPGLPGL